MATERILGAIALCALVAACSPEPDEAAVRSPGEGTIEQAVETRTRALDEARAVEGQVQDAHQRRLEAIDAQSRSDDGG